MKRWTRNRLVFGTSGSLSIHGALRKSHHIKLRTEATIQKALCNRVLVIGALPAQTLLIRTCDRSWSELVFKTLSEPLATRPAAGGIARRRWWSFPGCRSIVCRCKAVLDNNNTAMCVWEFSSTCNPIPTRPPATDVSRVDADAHWRVIVWRVLVALPCEDSQDWLLMFEVCFDFHFLSSMIMKWHLRPGIQKGILQQVHDFCFTTTGRKDTFPTLLLDMTLQLRSKRTSRDLQILL